MKSLPIKYIIVEGPDCAGKTSFCAVLNKDSGFIRNIRDRSYLSTLCYARLYDRPCVEQLRNDLQVELCNANNYIIILLPSKEVILERLLLRGDEFQNEVSILRLYDIFAEETEKLRKLPNVLVIDEALTPERLSLLAIKNITAYENFTPQLAGALMKMWTTMSKSAEIQFHARFNIPVDYRDNDVMDDPHEKEYYDDILTSCSAIINAEIAGNNPYGVPQGLDSRRFYYSSSSCISSIHFLPRDRRLNVICTLRSTDALKNGSIDLRFLAHLSSEVARRHAWQPNEISLEVNYNSLHIHSSEV